MPAEGGLLHLVRQTAHHQTRPTNNNGYYYLIIIWYLYI
jgi:hypothetical protein